ncbi:MAG: YdbH domain-containing protein [Deltaproteobacteria bacterium]|nr:YdbH domain-containing protein [Deltaproteobacteria bacterium]
MRIVKTIFLLLLVLAITLFTARFFLLNRLAAMTLHRSGANNITVHFSTIGFKQAHLDVLAATFKLPTGENLSVTLTGISVQYNLQQLLATGKCNRIIVKKMEVNRSGTTKIARTPLHLPKQVILLNNDLRSRLPLKEFSIEYLLLHGDLPSQLTDKIIQLDADIKGTSITATITLHADTDTMITVELKSPDAEHGTADIVGQQNDVEIIQARLELQPDVWSGAVDLQLNPVRDLLLQVANLPGLPEIDGRLDGNFSMPFPLQNNSRIQAEISLHDNKEQHLHLLANGNPITHILNLTLTGRKKKQEFLNTALAIKQHGITGNYSLQAALLRSFLEPYLKQPFPEISGTLAGKLDIPLPGNEDTAFTATILADYPALPGFSASTAQLQATGEIDGRNIHLAQGSQFSGKTLVQGNTRVDNLTLDLSGNFKWIEDRLQLNFAEKQNLQVKGLTAGRLHIANFNIHTEKPLQISYLKNNSSWYVDANTLHVSPLLLLDGARRLSTGPLTCKFQNLNTFSPNLELHTEIATPTAVLTNGNQELPLKDLNGTLQVAKNRINGKLQFAPAVIPGRVQANFDHNLATAAGSFTLRTDRRFDLNQDGVNLADLFTAWQHPYDLDSGKVSVKAAGSWAPGKDMQLSAFVAVTGGSGFYKQFLFKGLDLRHDLAVLPLLRSKSEGSVSVQQLIGGIDIHDIHAGLFFLPAQTGPLPQIRVKDFNTSAFNGIISCPEILYDLNQPDSHFVVNINKIDLGILLKLIKKDDLYVNGRMSGTIPVNVKGKDISVDDGLLYNEPPGGEIRYTPVNMNQSGITGYALKAVEDFRYNSLKTTAKYAPDGQLDLDISLVGTSPKLAADRPVHLNIHAEQNLPTLMQSLRFSKGLTEELDKRVKQHYK